MIRRATALALLFYAAVALRNAVWDDPLVSFVVWMTWACVIGMFVWTITARWFGEPAEA